MAPKPKFRTDERTGTATVFDRISCDWTSYKLLLRFEPHKVRSWRGFCLLLNIYLSSSQMPPVDSAVHAS
jgi:hypothetical protein